MNQTIKKLLFSTLLVLSLQSLTFATYQQPDILIYKGRSYDLVSRPLEVFYGGKSPEFWIEPNLMSSGHWRGYIATWEVINDRLYLTEIDSWFCRKSIKTKNGCRKVTLEDLFGKKVIRGKVSAAWYSGEIKVTDGEPIPCASEPNLPFFEREMNFEVKAGKVGNPSIIDNTKRLSKFKRCPPPPPKFIKVL